MKFIIHFGKRVCQRVYDHHLNPATWSVIKDQLNFPCLQANVYFKSYQIDSLVYEFNKEVEMVCYSDTISDINTRPVHGALTYHRHRIVFPDEVFQPVNLYYNISEGERSIYGTTGFKLIYETTNGVYLEVEEGHESQHRDRFSPEIQKVISLFS